MPFFWYKEGAATMHRRINNINKPGVAYPHAFAPVRRGAASLTDCSACPPAVATLCRAVSAGETDSRNKKTT